MERGADTIEGGPMEIAKLDGWSEATEEERRVREHEEEVGRRRDDSSARRRVWSGGRRGWTGRETQDNGAADRRSVPRGALRIGWGSKNADEQNQYSRYRPRMGNDGCQGSAHKDA